MRIHALAVGLLLSAGGVCAAGGTNSVLVTEVVSDCGAGQVYFAPAGRGSPDELANIKLVLRYIFNGTRITAKPGVEFSFEDSAGAPVATAEREQLLTPARVKWLGPSLVSALQELEQARAVLLAPQYQMKTPEQIMADSRFKAYVRAIKRAEHLARARFRLTAKDNLVDCD